MTGVGLKDFVVALLREPDVRAALRDALGSAESDDPWLSLEEAAARAGVKPRRLTDAERRGELELGRAGRSPRVRRSELERWMTSRQPRKAAARAPDDAYEDARRAVAATAARVGRAEAH